MKGPGIDDDARSCATPWRLASNCNGKMPTVPTAADGEAPTVGKSAEAVGIISLTLVRLEVDANMKPLPIRFGETGAGHEDPLG